jgi:hypothetical protein
MNKLMDQCAYNSVQFNSFYFRKTTQNKNGDLESEKSSSDKSEKSKVCEALLMF